MLTHIRYLNILFKKMGLLFYLTLFCNYQIGFEKKNKNRRSFQYGTATVVLHA